MSIWYCFRGFGTKCTLSKLHDAADLINLLHDLLALRTRHWNGMVASGNSKLIPICISSDCTDLIDINNIRVMAPDSKNVVQLALRPFQIQPKRFLFNRSGIHPKKKWNSCHLPPQTKDLEYSIPMFHWYLNIWSMSRSCAIDLSSTGFCRARGWPGSPDPDFL